MDTQRGACEPEAMILKWLKRAFLVLAIWLGVHVAAVGWRWAQVTLHPVDPVPRVIELDLRTDKSVRGPTIDIIGTRPTPSKGDYIGHLWVAWPLTPPGARLGSREAGYYADSQMQAVGAMAASLLLPWGFLTGQAPVPGHMKADDGWWRHFVIRIETDAAGLQRALAVDARWRVRRTYVLRPGVGSLGPSETIACQDYAFEVAAALGLRVPDRRDWTRFPFGSFQELADVNGLTPWIEAPGPMASR